MTDRLMLLAADEAALRMDKVRAQMVASGIEAVLVRDFSNIYYLTGRVFDGYVYMPLTGDALFFVRRPVNLKGDNVINIGKPEHIADHISGMARPALELDTLAFSAVGRLCKALDITTPENASSLLRSARSVKTPYEIDLLAADGVRHERVYSLVPRLYREGMTDIELQIEIERAARLEGCLGQFRIAGDSMELYMGNVLAGDNADAPSPYDFAMGGAGADPSLPVGADGTVICPGMAVMVDMNGNYNGYMTDMTRTYALGTLAEKALHAHDVSVEICHTLAAEAHPGMNAKDLYGQAMEIVERHGLQDYFMGHRQHAGFIGHGIGIQVNELPVIAPRSRDVLQVGNVIALEPKFVIPGTGAVGIENTYVLTADNGLQPLTHSPENIIYLPR